MNADHNSLISCPRITLVFRKVLEGEASLALEWLNDNETSRNLEIFQTTALPRLPGRYWTQLF